METTFSNKQKTLFGYVLSARENALLNHLFPSTIACLLFMLIVAIDIAVIFRHCKDNDPIWASLTLFFMCLPALGSFIIVITDWDYWPEPENGMTNENLYWLYKKVLGHIFFPVWNMLRFAERIFWSIEAALSKDEEEVYKCIALATEPRLIELYVFLQSYLHSLPQVILQLHILMRHNSDIARETKNTQAICILLSLAKVAVTTTFYQRFKAQKLTGSQYPWLKRKKIERTRENSGEDEGVQLRRSNNLKRVIEKQTKSDDISRLYDIEPSIIKERRRSSDIYLEPEPLSNERGTDIVVDSFQQNESTSHKKNSTTFRNSVARFSSMLGFRDVSIPANSQTDFSITRITYIKGLQEDDLAGKTVSFLWWFTFLVSRVLVISAFAYFFMTACIWLLIFHIAFVVLVLIYDVKTDNIKRDKMVFFIFIGLVYVFCIIEFKIRFKKANFIYYGFFVLVFLENIIMCLVWYLVEIDSLENDYWYRYMFYIILIAELLSVSSMIFYNILTKPKSVPIRVTPQD